MAIFVGDAVTHFIWHIREGCQLKIRVAATKATTSVPYGFVEASSSRSRKTSSVNRALREGEGTFGREVWLEYSLKNSNRAIIIPE